MLLACALVYSLKDAKFLGPRVGKYHSPEPAEPIPDVNRRAPDFQSTHATNVLLRESNESPALFYGPAGEKGQCVYHLSKKTLSFLHQHPKLMVHHASSAALHDAPIPSSHYSPPGMVEQA